MTDSLALYSARRGLGILGGTFDPVHAGHLCLARAALDAVPLVRVELMPAGEPREEVGPDMPLVLILGSDQWFNLSTWREWQSLTDFVHIAYCARDGVRESEIPESQALWAAPRMTEARKLVFSPSGRIARFEMAPHRASATAIRRTLAREPFARAMSSLDGWLDPGVASYIRTHGLYQPARH